MPPTREARSVMARHWSSHGCRNPRLDTSSTTLPPVMTLISSDILYETRNTHAKYRLCRCCFLRRCTIVEQRMKDSSGATGGCRAWWPRPRRWRAAHWYWQSRHAPIATQWLILCRTLAKHKTQRMVVLPRTSTQLAGEARSMIACYWRPNGGCRARLRT